MTKHAIKTVSLTGYKAFCGEPLVTKKMGLRKGQLLGNGKTCKECVSNARSGV